MQLQDLDKVKELSRELDDAQQKLDDVMASNQAIFPSYTKSNARAYGSIQLPPVTREVVLDAARAARDAIVRELKDLGVDAGGASHA